MTKTIFITGTSTGLGKLTAKHFSDLGWNVAATMRNPEKETELQNYKNVEIFKLDVTDLEQVKTATKQAIEKFGKIDVVVNNAGLGIYGALELANEKDIDWQIAVNVRGPINIIRAFLPHYRKNKEGMFINISSFMGLLTAVPVGSLYNMSKFALEGLTEGLYYELKPLNIKLHLIEQGGSKDNNFQNNIIWNNHPEIKDYDQITDKLKQLMSNLDDSLLDDPMLIIQKIDELATGKSNKFRNVIGSMGNNLVQLRNNVTIEDYLEKIYSNFM